MRVIVGRSTAGKKRANRKIQKLGKKWTYGTKVKRPPESGEPHKGAEVESPGKKSKRNGLGGDLSIPQERGAGERKNKARGRHKATSSLRTRKR